MKKPSNFEIIKELEEAKKAFSDLEKKCSKQDYTATIPEGYTNYILIAAYATSRLVEIDEDKLLNLEKDKVIHNSTISGGSLFTARECINNYMCGQRKFVKDQYEQLTRSCSSVIKIIELGIF